MTDPVRTCAGSPRHAPSAQPLRAPTASRDRSLGGRRKAFLGTWSNRAATGTRGPLSRSSPANSVDQRLFGGRRTVLPSYRARDMMLSPYAEGAPSFGGNHHMSKLTDSLREGAHALLDKASDWQERIRHRAQAIWEREGRPEGRHEDHWREAEKEIAAEDSATAAAQKKPAVSKARTAKAGPKPTRATEARAKKSAPLADAAASKDVSESTDARQARSATKSSRTTTPKTRRAAPTKVKPS